MLDCNYYKKTEFDFETMVSEFEQSDTRKVAENSGVSYPMAQQYLSTEDKYSHIRVPEVFIDAAMQLIKERKKSLESVNNKINKL